MLAQFLDLILNLKAQLPQVFNIDLVFAGTPVLRVGDTNLEFAQTGAIRLHGNSTAGLSLLPRLLPLHELFYWVREKYRFNAEQSSDGTRFE